MDNSVRTKAFAELARLLDAADQLDKRRKAVLAEFREKQKTIYQAIEDTRAQIRSGVIQQELALADQKGNEQ